MFDRADEAGRGVQGHAAVAEVGFALGHSGEIYEVLVRGPSEDPISILYPLGNPRALAVLVE